MSSCYSFFLHFFHFVIDFHADFKSVNNTFINKSIRKLLVTIKMYRSIITYKIYPSYLNIRRHQEVVDLGSISLSNHRNYVYDVANARGK